MELKVKKRLNKVVGEKRYFKWYIEIPSEIVRDLKLIDGEMLKVLRMR